MSHTGSPAEALPARPVRAGVAGLSVAGIQFLLPSLVPPPGLLWHSVFAYTIIEYLEPNNFSTGVARHFAEQIIRGIRIILRPGAIDDSITARLPIKSCCWGPLHTHEPRAVTRKLWEPKRKWPKAIPRHLQNHVVWSQILKCSVMSYVTGSSTKCYFNECLL